jgi:hypothetical protein
MTIDKEKSLELRMGNEVARWTEDNPAQWGSKRKLSNVAGTPRQELVQWQPGFQNAQIVLDLPSPEIPRVPQVQTIMLGAQIINPHDNARFFPRWLLELGTGGARVSFVLDAQRLQQVTVPAVTTRASFFLDYADQGNTLFRADDTTVFLVAYEADGNSNTTPAQYTQPFIVGAATADVYTPPAGANRVRVVSADLGGDVFAANTTYTFRQGTTGYDQYLGTEMKELHTAGGFVPIPAAANNIRIAVAGATGAGGFLLYELEL